MKTMFMAMLLAMLTGCASQYFPDHEPTAVSVQAAGGQQIYKKTLYTAADFTESGSLKRIGQYDLMSESAPCTALGDIYAEPAIYKEQIFVVETKTGEQKNTLLFQCRNPNIQAGQFRLYLIGSKADCATRTWDMRYSNFYVYRKMGRMCTVNYMRNGLQDIEAMYKATNALKWL